MRAAARFYVSGIVQGVSFRYHTQRQARTLGVTGYARNLPDGRVEVLAVGPGTAIERLAEWLEHGPSLARVSDVERAAAEPDEWLGRGFETG